MVCSRVKGRIGGVWLEWERALVGRDARQCLGMSMKFGAMAATLGAILVGFPAGAATVNLTRQSDGYTYFSRPGATLPTMQRELEYCFSTISGFDNNGATFSPSLLGAAIDAMLYGAMRDQMQSTNLENCMVVRGWRVVRVTDSEGSSLAHLQPEQLAGKLQDWVGSPSPNGTVVRFWDNDAAKPDTIKHAFPGLSSKPTLSQLSLRGPSTKPVDVPKLPPMAGRPFAMGIPRPVKSAELGNLPPDSALIIITLRNSAPREMVQLQMARMGAAYGAAASLEDHRPDGFGIGLPKTMSGVPSGGPVAITVGYVVPAGRWFIYNIADVQSLCLGSPFIDVKAGDVVHTGSFEFSRDGLPIDPSLDPATIYLADHPDLKQRLRSASWTNGATYRCGATYDYALEFPSAPFADGYVRAGRPWPLRDAPGVDR
jgi:hypothetical protein